MIALISIWATCRAERLTEQTRDLGLQNSERHGYSVYDSMIVAAGPLADCSILCSKDFHDGQVLKKCLTVRNSLLMP